MSEDPRMHLVISVKKDERHDYAVLVRGKEFFRTADRHLALQSYVGQRVELNDFASEPENYLVQMFCDSKEYYCDQEKWPQGWGDRGKSCRQLNGAVRPYPWERHMP